ncbi:hypothetical protein [Streptomyces alkaliterrae]|uniref:Uncharacterized protein n=1 Tax=Streptomyces alkaliterrae TaxID=2213162 RepID=A0A7W3X1F1_9ACTN|nr:hypothetical protein [Streptomyces alkaliterrae]MBB1262383.1 hypothetical protein [Streptomyces alkaliterrae]
MNALRKRTFPTVAAMVAGGMLAVGTLGTVGTAHAAGAPAAPPTATAPATAADNQAAAAAFAAATSDLTPEEQEALREIAAAIWNPDLAAGWNMNAAVAEVLSEATEGILRCSEAFALVPRPPGFMPGLGYLRNYWKQIRDYFLVVKQNRTYRICVINAASRYRSPMEMASMGI